MSKQKVLTVFILLLAFTYVKGQDKIITTQNDTIFCKIVSISLIHIRYEQKNYDQITVENSIPLKQVYEYSFGLRSQDSYPLPSKREQEQPVSIYPLPSRREQSPTSFPVSSNIKPSVKKQSKEPFHRWRIGFQGGGSYLINSLAPSREAMKNLGLSPRDQANEYYKRLRDGISGGGDVYYLFSKSFGLGVKYSFFTSSVEMDYTAKDPNLSGPVYFYVSEKEQFFLNYFGLSLFFRQWISRNHKFSLNEELSGGYILYRDEAQFDPYQYVFVNPETNKKQYNILREGNTFSGTFQLSLEYHPASWISVGVGAGVYPSVFRSLNISDNDMTNSRKNLDKDNYLDLSRVDYFMGVRFHF